MAARKEQGREWSLEIHEGRHTGAATPASSTRAWRWISIHTEASARSSLSSTRGGAGSTFRGSQIQPELGSSISARRWTVRTKLAIWAMLAGAGASGQVSAASANSGAMSTDARRTWPILPRCQPFSGEVGQCWRDFGHSSANLTDLGGISTRFR